MLFQSIRILHAFACHYSNTKINFQSVFLKFSSDKITLCNNNDQTWSSDTLTSARPLRVVKNPHLSGLLIFKKKSGDDNKRIKKYPACKEFKEYKYNYFLGWHKTCILNEMCCIKMILCLLSFSTVYQLQIILYLFSVCNQSS